MNRAIIFKNVFDTPHLHEMRVWRNQDYVQKHMINHHIITEEEHRMHILKLRKSLTQRVFVVFENNNPIAVINFNYDYNNKYIETGTYLIKQEYQGRGLGLIIKYAQCQHIFSIMPEGRFRLVVLNINDVNIRMANKLGFQYSEEIEIKVAENSVEKATIFYLTKNKWEEKRLQIEDMISTRIPIENIGDIRF